MGKHGHDHGHHHPELPKIPDYKIYKVENCPELLGVQQALAAKGLKDPWLRNEVWRYDPAHMKTHQFRFKSLFFRGMGIGLAAAIITAAIGYKFPNTYHDPYTTSHHDHEEHSG